MITDWKNKYSKIMKDFEGYSIGKILKYLNDPEIISLAGGLPSPDMFQKTKMREVSKKLLETNLENIFQYTAVTGEENLKSAIIITIWQKKFESKNKNIEEDGWNISRSPNKYDVKKSMLKDTLPLKTKKEYDK